MGKTIHSRERELILKVLAFFEREKEMRKFLTAGHPSDAEASEREEKLSKKYVIPGVHQVIERTCAATGISKSTLLRIKRQARSIKSSLSPLPSGSTGDLVIRPPTPGKKRKPSSLKIDLDGFELASLRNIVSSFYTVKNEAPTVNKILAVAKTELCFPGSVTTLRRIVNQLGYKCKKCKNGRMVMIQKPNIAAWRSRYLRRIKENTDLWGDQRPVTYLDETCIDSQYIVKKYRQNRSNGGVVKKVKPGQRLILVHAGGKNGFIPGAEFLYKCSSTNGDYHHDLNLDNFTNWLEEKLIPSLPPMGLVVIDNMDFFSKQSEKMPSRSSSKTEMENWCIKNKISFGANMTRLELYHLIRTNKPEKKCNLSKLLSEHGHEVLRLPPHHWDLNPIKYIWNLIQQRLADKNINDLESQIENLTKEVIASVTLADWKKEMSNVKILENEYLEKDRLQERFESELIASYGGEESSSGSDNDKVEDDDSDNDAMSGIEDLNPSGIDF